MNEVEIYVGPDRERFATTPFGKIWNGPRFCDGRLIDEQAGPVICVLAVDVCAALQPGGEHSYGGVISTATPDGMFRVDSLDGTFVWELFPARRSDGNGGPVYVGVWPD